MKRAILIVSVLAGCGGGGSDVSSADGTPATLTLTPSFVELKRKGDTATISALVKNSLGNGINYAVSWSSSNPAAVTISNRGLVTAITCGGTDITATAGSVVSQADVVVRLPESVPSSETFAPSLGVNLATMTQQSTSLYRSEITVGTGALVGVARTLTVRYQNRLTNGTSVGAGDLVFQLGAGQVIPGWDQGIPGMRVGGKRRLVIGSGLALSGQAQGPIPCNSTLISDVEVLSQS